MLGGSDVKAAQHGGAQSSSASRSRRPPQIVGRLGGLRVLAVEDNEDSLELLCELLGQAGAIVTPADSVACALAEPGPFDIIVSDIGMPVADGYELIRKVRSREVGGDVPAIAVTAFTHREDVERARRAGFQAHVAKPYKPDELLATIERCTRTN